MSEDALFAHDVDLWIKQSVAAGPITFADLLRVLPGVDPSLVRARIAVAPEHVRVNVHWTPISRPVEPPDPRLPMPHPLDYDWRFSRSTLRDLADEVIPRDAERLTLLGAPSLWMILLGRARPRHVRLLDANPQMLEVARALNAVEQVSVVDLLKDDVPLFLSDVVVADPPWYPEVLVSFLWVGSFLLRTNGLLFLSIPPKGTRSSVQRELEELIGLMNSLGLTLRSISPGALRYVSPPFERAALRAVGLAPYVPSDWRRGDLLVLQRTGDLVASRPVLRNRRWTERIIGGVRIQIDDAAPQDGIPDPRLISLLDNDVLPSVSRRDARRAGARVWTSGNRIFGCNAPTRLVETIDAVVAGLSPQRREDREAAEGIRALVECERAEYISPDD